MSETEAVNVSDPVDQGPSATSAAAQALATAPPSLPQAAEWWQALPETLRTDPNIAKFRDGRLEDFAEAYRNAVKLIGVPPDQIIRVSDDRMAALRKLGAPEKPDSYQFTPPEGVPEELALGGALDWYREVAAKAGLLPEQAQAVYEAYVRKTAEMREAFTENVRKAEASLRLEWGPQYDGNIAAAKKAVSALGLEEAVAEAGLGANPAFVKAMVAVSRAMFPAETGPTGGQGPVLPADPAEARAEAKRLMEQAFQAHRAGRREESAALQRRAAELFKRAVGE
jgi:hypothetical protein